MLQLQSALGLIAFCVLAWAMSENHRRIPLRTVLIGLALQFVIALLLFKLPLFKDAFVALNELVLALQQATADGTSFVFGYLGGGPLPFEQTRPGADFVLAFRALPLVLVVSALSALLFYWNILPAVVKGFSWALQKSLGIGGAVGVATAANIFVGMVEAPLFIRPYLIQLSRSELFVVMASGMATIAGTMMVLYAGLLAPVVPEAMGHILTASVISAPAAIVVAQLMIPSGTTKGMTSAGLDLTDRPTGAMDAVTRGTLQGVGLLINIVAMLVVLVALVSLANQLLGLFPDLNGQPLTLQRMLGVLMAPVVWLMGIPWAEAQTAGALMGTKTVLNEFIAYMDLAQLPEDALSTRSRLMMTYALCGFANLGSLGIMIGGLATMVPERRQEIVGLGFKSIVAGTLATCMTGAVIGIL